MHRLYVAMQDGLETRSRTNGTWTARSASPANRLECVAAGAEHPDRVFCGTFEEGLLRSTDAGRTFSRIGRTEIDFSTVTSLAIDPHDSDTILAGTEPSALFQSTDGGDHWERIDGLMNVQSAGNWSFPPRPDTHHVRCIEIAPHNPDRWYVGIEAGALLVTPDAGTTWIDRPDGSRRDNHWIATHPSAPDRVYAAAGDGYAESRDGGRTWTHPQEGLSHRYVWSVAVETKDPDTRVISAATGPRTAHRHRSAESYMYRRSGDARWERLADVGLPIGEGVTRPLIATTAGIGQMYAVSNHGIFTSDNAGDRWESVPGNWSPRYTAQTAQGIAALAI